MIKMETINHELGKSWGVNAYLLPNDLKAGTPIIYLGGDMEHCENTFTTRPYCISQKEILDFPSYTDYLEANIESVLSHETIHVSIYEQTGNIKTVRALDNIDNRDEITGFTPYDSCG